jgi:hypothetical protein
MFTFLVSSLSTCIDYTFTIILQSYYLEKIICVSSHLILIIQYSIALPNFKISIGFLLKMTNISLIIGELPLTIQCMIENTLLHSILDTIYEQIVWPWGIRKNGCKFDPLYKWLEFRKWGSALCHHICNCN